MCPMVGAVFWWLLCGSGLFMELLKGLKVPLGGLLGTRGPKKEIGRAHV